jgi:hypothetical protein
VEESQKRHSRSTKHLDIPPLLAFLLLLELDSVTVKISLAMITKILFSIKWRLQVRKVEGKRTLSISGGGKKKRTKGW